MSWGQNKRVNSFLRMAENDGIKIVGTKEELIEFFYAGIPFLAKRLQNNTKRYYLLGEGRLRDNNTGLILKEDSLFHQDVRGGREGLITILKLAKGNIQTALNMLKED